MRSDVEVVVEVLEWHFILELRDVKLSIFALDDLDSDTLVVKTGNPMASNCAVGNFLP